ncbi:MAG: hypoxanthine phosphoribosyltransferase [Tannerellaceae bacterium]|jgi:hypoxanthine phosphoribosyltransferase|nr:hypoxanthine phosphoribosyltransferase [Tannerellaceae bacterium]
MKKRVCVKDKEFELFLSEEEIKRAIGEIAFRIKRDLSGAHPLFVSILNGAFMFTAELMRHLDAPHDLVFARYSSYRGMETTGKVIEIMPVTTSIKGRTVILLEDIVDTGTTMQYVMEKLRQAGAEDIRLATLLFKPAALRCNLRPDYVGLEIPPVFIVGYGLDYNESGRTFKDIYRLVK